MPPRVHILFPRSLRTYWTGIDAESAELVGETLAEAIGSLGKRWPGLDARILDDRGRVREHVLIFLNDQLVPHVDPADIALREGDTLRVVPAVSGGC